MLFTHMPSVFQVLKPLCPTDTDLAQASPWSLGGWVRQCHSLLVAALWAKHLGVAALADCVRTTAVEWKRSGCKAVCLEEGLE